MREELHKLLVKRKVETSTVLAKILDVELIVFIPVFELVPDLSKMDVDA